MNLLEHLCKELSGPKELLARQLLVRPWNMDSAPLKPHLPAALYRLFLKLQRDVHSRLLYIQRGEVPLARIATDAVWIGVHAQLPDGSSGLLNGNDKVWADHIWAQVVEDLEQEKISSLSLSNLDHAAFVALYSVAHACLFVISGLVTRVAATGQLVFDRNPEAAQAHRLYWFGHYWSHQSTMADHLHILKFLSELKERNEPLHRAVRSGAPGFHFLCDFFFDKFLSLHPDYIAYMHTKDQSILQQVAERMGIVLYIYLSTVEKQIAQGKNADEQLFNTMLSIEIAEGEIAQAGFSREILEALLAESNQQPVGDQLLRRAGAGNLQVGNLSLKYALRKYCHANLSSMDFRGDWFEQDYIANYIRDRVPPDRYRVFPGINDKAAKYDADVIIQDTRSQALLFCQIKHRTAMILPHLRDELKEYSGNSQIRHGLQQLQNLRSRLDCPDVIEKIRQRIGNRQLNAIDLTQRAGFLLVHNIENLDFCTYDDIGMYEWNTLRNLLKGQISEVTLTNAKTVSLPDTSLAIHDPHQVMEAMLRWFDQQPHADQPTAPRQQWPVFMSSRLMFRIWRNLWVKKWRIAPTGSSEISFPLI